MLDCPLAGAALQATWCPLDLCFSFGRVSGIGCVYRDRMEIGVVIGGGWKLMEIDGGKEERKEI